MAKKPSLSEVKAHRSSHNAFTSRIFRERPSSISDKPNMLCEPRQPSAAASAVCGGIDVRSIRSSLGLSQEEFARRFHLSVGAVREWEQGRRHPELAARILLRVILHNPQAVVDALASVPSGVNAPAQQQPLHPAGTLDNTRGEPR